MLWTRVNDFGSVGRYLSLYSSSPPLKFGDEVFNIFQTSQDQKDLEMKIVEAYDKAKSRIDKMTGKVTKAGRLTGHQEE